MCIAIYIWVCVCNKIIIHFMHLFLNTLQNAQKKPANAMMQKTHTHMHKHQNKETED